MVISKIRVQRLVARKKASTITQGTGIARPLNTPLSYHWNTITLPHCFRRILTTFVIFSFVAVDNVKCMERQQLDGEPSAHLHVLPRPHNDDVREEEPHVPLKPISQSVAVADHPVTGKTLSSDHKIDGNNQGAARIEGLDVIKSRSHEPIVRAIHEALRSDKLGSGVSLCQIEALPVSPRVFVINCNNGRKYSLRAMFVSSSPDLRNATVRARAIMSHVNFAKSGVSPKVFAYDVEHGILISEYIDDDPLKFKKNDRHSIEQLTSLLKRIHITPRSRDYNLYYVREFSPYSVLKSSVEKIISLYSEQLSWHNETIFYMKLIYEVLSPYFQNTLCHYDMHPLNLLRDKQTQKLYVIDWDTAFVGDPVFDLATLSCLSNFDQSHDDMLLSSYYGCPPSQEELAHFFLMKQHVYLFYSLHMIKSYNNPNIYMTDEERTDLGVLNPNHTFSHPLTNTPQDNYHCSILFSNTAFHHIKTKDFYRHLFLVLSTHASHYSWLNNIQPHPSILSWLCKYVKKTNTPPLLMSPEHIPTTSIAETCIRDNRLGNNLHRVFFHDMLTLQAQLSPHSHIPERALSVPQLPSVTLPLFIKKQFDTFITQMESTYLGRKWLENTFIYMETKGFLRGLEWKKHRDAISYTLHSASLGKDKTFEEAFNAMANRFRERLLPPNEKQ